MEIEEAQNHRLVEVLFGMLNRVFAARKRMPRLHASLAGRDSLPDGSFRRIVVLVGALEQEEQVMSVVMGLGMKLVHT